MSKENTIISLLKEINKNIDKSAVNLEDITITDNGEYTCGEVQKAKFEAHNAAVLEKDLNK